MFSNHQDFWPTWTPPSAGHWTQHPRISSSLPYRPPFSRALNEGIFNSMSFIFHTFTMLFQKVSRIGERKFRKYYYGNTFQAWLFLFFHSNFYFMPRWIWPCLPPFQWNLLLFTILDSLFTFSFHVFGLSFNFYNFGLHFYFLFSLSLFTILDPLWQFSNINLLLWINSLKSKCGSSSHCQSRKIP